MISLHTNVQMTLVDFLELQKETVIENWAMWRDAQCSNDADKRIVDDAYHEYIRTLDKLISTLVPF